MAISFDAKKNFATSVVATAPVTPTAGTSLVVGAGHGALFPAAPFNVVVWPTGVQPTAANSEIMRVTAKATDTFTVTRAQEGTVARTVIVGDQIALNTTAKSFTDIEAAFVTASALTAPIGGAMIWFTDTAPTGWLLLRGQAVSRATYATLFALIGTTFGAGDGSTTFNLPDLQSRIPIGKGLSGTLATLGATAGSWDHTHGPGTLAVASHTHGPGSLQVASHTHGAGTLQTEAHTHGGGTLAVAAHTHFVEGDTTTDGSHSHSGTADNGGEHTHTYDLDMLFGHGDGGIDTPVGMDGVTETGGSAHSHTLTINSNGDHNHEVDLETSSASPGLSGSTGSSAAAITSGATGSSAPLVDTGATGGTAPAVSTGVTGAGNPPVLVVNFIIRATNEV